MVVADTQPPRGRPVPGEGRLDCSLTLSMTDYTTPCVFVPRGCLFRFSGFHISGSLEKHPGKKDYEVESGPFSVFLITNAGGPPGPSQESRRRSSLLPAGRGARSRNERPELVRRKYAQDRSRSRCIVHGLHLRVFIYVWAGKGPLA